MQLGVFAGLLASAGLLSASPARAWTSGTVPGEGNCATVVATNAVIGCAVYGNDFEVFEYYDDGFGDGWGAIANNGGGTSAGTFVANDIIDQLWVVGSTGIVYYGYYTGITYVYGGTAPGGTPAATWQELGSAAISANPGTIKTLGVGSPYGVSNEVWATDSNGNVLMWSGRVSGGDTGQGGVIGDGLWWQVAAVPNGAVKVGVFAELENDANCSIHTPWVIDTQNNIYKYEVVDGGSCLSGSWVRQPGAAIDITNNDYVIGTDHQAYQWNPSASNWTFLGQPSLASGVVLTHIGSSLNSRIFTVSDSTKTVWFY